MFFSVPSQKWLVVYHSSSTGMFPFITVLVLPVTNKQSGFQLSKTQEEHAYNE